MKKAEFHKLHPPNTSGSTQSDIQGFSFNNKNVNEANKEDYVSSPQSVQIDSCNSLDIETISEMPSCSRVGLNTYNDISSIGSKTVAQSEMQPSHPENGDTNFFNDRNNPENLIVDFTDPCTWGNMNLPLDQLKNILIEHGPVQYK